MGVDAYLDLAQIGHGLHLVADIPQFLVRGPVALAPVYPLPFGGHVNLSSYHQILDLAIEAGEAELIIIHNERKWPIFAITVFPRDRLARYCGETTPGCIPLEECEKNWSAIEPGLWLVTRFFVSGMGDDAPSFSAWLPKEVEVRKTLHMRIYT